jgi:glycosyltransferase involved in cell wall biosynthesis
MRVALAVDWFLKYASEQAIGLRQAGAEVLLMAREHLQPMDEFDGDRGEWEAVIERAVAAGVEVQVVPGRSGSMRAARAAGAARRRISGWRPDIVHVHPTADPWMHLYTLGFPLVLTVHDVVPHPGQPRLNTVKTFLREAWRRRADGFVVHGDALAAALRPVAAGRRVAVIPHGVTPSSAPYPAPARKCVLFFGRLEPYKGLAVLAEAMTDVWAAVPDAELIVAGRGPAAAQVPEDPRIRRLFGYIPEEDVDGLFREASLVAAPYTEASQSGVVALAVARGIPAVVSDQGALPEVALDPSFITPAGDAAALGRALVAHLGDDITVRAAVHRMAVERLSWCAAADLSLAFYEELLAV